jgi:hypothetical protein
LSLLWGRRADEKEENIINGCLMRIYSGVSIALLFFLLRQRLAVPQTCRNKTTLTLTPCIRCCRQRRHCHLFHEIELNFFLISFHSFTLSRKEKASEERARKLKLIAAFNLILLLCDFYVPMISQEKATDHPQNEKVGGVRGLP